ncbi:MAG: MmcQ/YjbR family DNA-binding protein [Gammaproteobacteria bacterium]|nr:MmcQ/YjbR family DNA-binding protein [Gammaproteobacteria bacterium]
MTAEQLRKYCMSLPGATENIQWGEDRVFKIGGKMFACSGIEKDSRYSFKVEDARFLELTDLEGVHPAPYLARAKWVQIEPKRCKLSKKDLQALVKKSHELVLAKLTKKKQREILGSD